MAQRYLWLLDNGHGGVVDGVPQTPGKRSPVWSDGRQMFEGEYNRAIVRRISRALDDAGVAYVPIVPELIDVPLFARVDRANAFMCGGLVPILVSVHGNAGRGTGWEVWTSLGQTTSDRVASIFHRNAAIILEGFPARVDLTDGDPDKEAKFAILTKTVMPAILTENLFMDTLHPDCSMMMSETGRDLIASIHIAAILEIERDGL